MTLSIGTPISIIEGDWIGSKGIVRGIDHALLQLDETGNFISDGIVFFESEISTLEFPNTFDGTTLEITYPARNIGGILQEEDHEQFKVWKVAYLIEIENLNFKVPLYDFQIALSN